MSAIAIAIPHPRKSVPSTHKTFGAKLHPYRNPPSRPLSLAERPVALPKKPIVYVEQAFFVALFSGVVFLMGSFAAQVF